MSRAVSFRDGAGHDTYVSVDHVRSVIDAPLFSGFGSCLIDVGSAEPIRIGTYAEEVAALIWPERWQACVWHTDDEPEDQPAPVGWEPIGPWAASSVSGVGESMRWQTGCQVLWTRPLRRVAVTP